MIQASQVRARRRGRQTKRGKAPRTVPPRRLPLLVPHAFSGPRAPGARERMKHIEAMGQDYALYEDGEMVACLRLFPMRMFIHGASVPLSGVSHVACLPEQRRH